MGRARLAIAQGVSVWVLEAPEGFGDAGFHAHHAIQITVALTGRLSLATADGAIEARALAVAADARHRLDAAGLLAFVFVEPESSLGRAIGAAVFADAPLVALDAERLLPALAPLARTFDAPLGNAALLAAGAAAVDALVPPVESRLPDPRIARLLAHVAEHPDQPLDAAAAAAGVHLSPSRLRHLFVEQTGLPYKTYMLWLRLVRAVQDYSQGCTLTEAAHAAGFSDSAHFSRIFRRTFGTPATRLTRL